MRGHRGTAEKTSKVLPVAIVLRPMLMQRDTLYLRLPILSDLSNGAPDKQHVRGSQRAWLLTKQLKLAEMVVKHDVQ